MQQLDYRTLIPLWRSAKYIRKYDNLNSVPGIILDPLDSDQILDQYKIEKTDVYYTSGAFLNIKSSTKEQYYLLGCYLNPNITETGYNSWVAKDHPYAIVFDAAATVFKAIGKDEEAAAYKRLVEEQMQMIKISNIIQQGY